MRNSDLSGAGAVEAAAGCCAPMASLAAVNVPSAAIAAVLNSRREIMIDLAPDYSRTLTEGVLVRRFSATHNWLWSGTVASRGAEEKRCEPEKDPGSHS